MKTILCYNRWQEIFPVESGVNEVVFTAENGTKIIRPTFYHQPAIMQYDQHGYEHVVPDSDKVLAVRFSPTIPGKWQWRAMEKGKCRFRGSFLCDESSDNGFVEISRHDPRYFALSNGMPFVPIGLNLVAPPQYPLPAGGEFAQSQQLGTLGAQEYRRWFIKLANNGGNYARLWLSHPYFSVDGENAGEIDLTAFARLDEVILLARSCGIKLKLCLEHFRHVGKNNEPQIFTHIMRNPETGEIATNMDEWFQNETWQQLWWKKIDAYLARYGNDPVVMAWELWNEIDCCSTSNWRVQRDWTEKTLIKLKSLTPANLVTNSLGSFDWHGKQAIQNDFHMNAMDFQQIHRYLDQGAGLDICKSDTVALSVDGVIHGRRDDRPVILTETGAVNNSHTGPFRYYRWDEDGLIFHDTTYPAFFAGAAGSGHIWHWDQYVDQKNLWPGFKALAQVIDGIAIDQEYFRTIDLSTDKYWCLILKGRTCTLGWLRSKYDNWDRILRDRKIPMPINAVVDFNKIIYNLDNVELFHPWPDDGTGQSQHWIYHGEPEFFDNDFFCTDKVDKATIVNSTIKFPEFYHGLLFRIWHCEI